MQQDAVMTWAPVAHEGEKKTVAPERPFSSAKRQRGVDVRGM